MSDTRFAAEPANRRANVFARIVQPMPEHPHSVQAEVHARCRASYNVQYRLLNVFELTYSCCGACT